MSFILALDQGTTSSRALPTAPVEVVHTRRREAQIYLTLALRISIYRLEFRTVRKSLG